MDDLLLVAMVQRLRHVQHVPRPLLLAKPPLAQLLVKLAPRRELQDEVDSPLVVEVAEQSEDIPVSCAQNQQRETKAEDAACSSPPLVSVIWLTYNKQYM